MKNHYSAVLLSLGVGALNIFRQTCNLWHVSLTSLFSDNSWKSKEIVVKSTKRKKKKKEKEKKRKNIYIYVHCK